MYSHFFLRFQVLCGLANALVSNPSTFVGSRPPLPEGFPGSLPPYMRSNVNNQFGTAPDKGLFTGPVLGPISPTDASKIHPGVSNQTATPPSSSSIGRTRRSGMKGFNGEDHDRLHGRLDATIVKHKNLPRQSDSYWLDNIAHGKMPLAPSNYTFFRNVKTMYGAAGDGKTDDTAAINQAIVDGNRCGANCGSTSVLGALIYFPPGNYMVSSPLVQYYYTQFVGDPVTPPTLTSTYNFTGIAIVDSDFYIVNGSGNEWYLNQNNFYRQIRNINFDLSNQAPNNTQNDQLYVPTGIHWQAGQATSITNCQFKMAVSTATQPATGVGIFMENGSGGFMSDLTFFGGNAGMVAGSQQFTMRNMQFTSCLQAVSMLWNWGMTWQNIYVNSCYIAFNCTSHGGSTGQGTGSLSVLDSHFNGVPYAITVSNTNPVPNLVLDNLLIEASDAVVLVSGGETIFPGTTGQITVESWAMGGAYLTKDGRRQYLTGYVSPSPSKPSSLIDGNGRWFTQAKPLYTNVAGGSIVVATAHSVANDMTGDQTSAINSLLAANIGSIVFFPAGIYLVKSTVFVPKGSIIVGEGWSQIMATGPYFQDQTKPNVMVRVGNAGDSGSIQIQDMLFTVQGNTSGCILMEWNIAQTSQGSAAIWDSHFRVGGAAGTNLQQNNCQNVGPGAGCNAAAMLLHLTPMSSGYFENVWAWVSDHDLDNPLNANAYETTDGVPQNVETQINIYAGRGILIESQGPVWFWGSASEHSELYNYQLSGAQNIFMAHMQTESPYYQPEQNFFLLGYPPNQGGFANDPTFQDCSASNCISSWALRMVNSSNIFIYSAGFYSFFHNLQLGCGNSQTCQEHLIETNFVGNLYLYNLFTYGATELVSPAGGLIPPIFFNDSNQSGYTSEVAAWLALSGTDGLGIGVNDTGSGVVYIDPTIWVEPSASQTVQCYPPCTFVLPPVTLSAPTTISFPPWTTSLEVGWTTSGLISTVISGTTATISTTYYTYIIETTTLFIPPLTTTLIPVWNTDISGNVTSTTIWPTSSILPPPIYITDGPNPLNQTGVSHPPVTRTIYPPPYPFITSSSSHDTHYPPITYTRGPPKPTCRAGCGTRCRIWCHPCNPLLPAFLGGCTGTDFCISNCPAGTGPGDDGGSDPNDPDRPDESSTSCSPITTSQCSSLCISGSSCTQTCSTIEGCKITPTNLASTETPAGYWTGDLEPWNSNSHNAGYHSSVMSAVQSSLVAEGVFFTTGSPATVIPSVSVPASTTPQPTTSPSTTAPKPTRTITSTYTYSTTVGYLQIWAERRIEGGPKGPPLQVDDYDLNFFPPRITYDPCTGGNMDVYGVASPTPKNWDDIPRSVSFFSTITSYSRKYSNCIYTNTAAPATNGDGGSLSCAGVQATCTIARIETLSCDIDLVGGAPTSIRPLINCPVIEPTTGITTIVTVS